MRAAVSPAARPGGVRQAVGPALLTGLLDHLGPQDLRAPEDSVPR
ncbi:hypothetical protein [Actinotalea sp.]